MVNDGRGGGGGGRARVCVCMYFSANGRLAPRNVHVCVCVCVPVHSSLYHRTHRAERAHGPRDAAWRLRAAPRARLAQRALRVAVDVVACARGELPSVRVTRRALEAYDRRVGGARPGLAVLVDLARRTLRTHPGERGGRGETRTLFG